jgi:hypothetical protein
MVYSAGIFRAIEKKMCSCESQQPSADFSTEMGRRTDKLPTREKHHTAGVVRTVSDG